MAILAAGSATAAIAGALLVLAVTAAVLCSPATGGDVFASENTDGRGHQAVVPAMYVFGDSLLDVGNDNLLPPPAPLSAPPNGIDLPPAVSPRTGRYTNGYNLADIILRIRWITGNGTIISLREQVQLFTKTKLTITRAGLVDPEKLDDLLARSLFLVSTGGNDFDALGNGGVPMSRAPEFIAGMVADYVKYINVRVCLSVYCTRIAMLRTEMSKALTASMPSLKYSIGSMYNAYSDMIANPELAGLREVKRACCGGGKFNGEVECSVASSRLCTGRDEHLFWDMAHGTQAAYHWAALAFIYGPARDAEPINLAQLMQEESMVAAAPYSSI